MIGHDLISLLKDLTDAELEQEVYLSADGKMALMPPVDDVTVEVVNDGGEEAIIIWGAPQQ